MNDTDFMAESYRVEGGGSAYRLTHRPTGLFVDDPGPSELPIDERWLMLRMRLLALVTHEQEAGEPNVDGP
jgi:hypothetical protein